MAFKTVSSKFNQVSPDNQIKANSQTTNKRTKISTKGPCLGISSMVQVEFLCIRLAVIINNILSQCLNVLLILEKLEV